MIAWLCNLISESCDTDSVMVYSYVIRAGQTSQLCGYWLVWDFNVMTLCVMYTHIASPDSLVCCLCWV